ncbi:MAG TPA: N-acetylglucosamine-6-phosphate deacetylase [Streptosporangiaceae bacterium]|jgi:N-acetylglucosamine-6-phosphate deacetylase|nr:N-acetylglucosamine-6-phosphate deacetylase [Streptosporangiaceae bacterium]
MTSLLIAAERLIVTRATAAPAGSSPSQVVSPGYVRLDGGHIAEVDAGRPPGRPDVELTGGTLAPGLIDLQVNGYYGHDLVDADEAGWHTVVRRLPETGVTAFLPTFITAPIPTLVAALRTAAHWLSPSPSPSPLPSQSSSPFPSPSPASAPGGSRVLGVHLEGPFLSRDRRGAHNAEWLTDPTPEAVRTLLAAGPVTIVTLAPERAGGLDAVRALSQAGVLVSVGHSDATADQVKQAADAGARMITHLFNAQSGVHHRAPGVAAQALADARLTAGLIADMAHVAPVVCKVAFAAAPGRIVLVTDAAAAAGMPPGRYDLGGEPIDLPADGPPLRADGTIAGSALRLDAAVGNVAGLGVDLAVAVDAATRVPADLIGRPDLGRIAPGAAADLVWLAAADAAETGLRARATWIGGELVFENTRRPWAPAPDDGPATHGSKGRDRP